MRSLFLACLVVLASAPAAWPVQPPPVEASSYVLLEAQTGQVLASHRPHEPRPPASTTKILTALLVLERLRLDDVVVASRRASLQREGSSIGFEVGERRTVRELLYALLVKSANDAAVVLAEAVDGTVERFVARMNRRAQALGARHTHFTNPHGLYDPGHVTTAYDLALIARAAMQNPTFRQIVRTQVYEYMGLEGPMRLVNGNRLLGRYPGADGIKTGWTVESGRCLVASATRNGRRLVAVLLNAPQVFQDAARLLDYGFGAFELRTFVRRGEVMERLDLSDGVIVSAVASRDLVASVSRLARTDLRVVYRPDLRPPIKAGEVIGRAEVWADGRRLGQVALLAGETVPAISWPPFLRWLYRR